jgi:hypothetical protein
MGYSEVGGNGSVHWEVAHSAERSGVIRGRDPVSLLTVGRKRGLKRGSYKVSLRYDTADAARRALENATIEKRNGKYFVTLYVPLVARTKPHYERNDSAEVRVDW